MQLLTLLPRLVSLVDEVPKDEDVKAGWLALAIFVGLILAVAFLGFSLVKQLRKAQAAEDAGVYGHDESDETPDHDSPEADGSNGKPADNQAT
jgi:hypothetical protein